MNIGHPCSRNWTSPCGTGRRSVTYIIFPLASPYPRFLHNKYVHFTNKTELKTKNILSVVREAIEHWDRCTKDETRRHSDRGSETQLMGEFICVNVGVSVYKTYLQVSQELSSLITTVVDNIASVQFINLFDLKLRLKPTFIIQIFYFRPELVLSNVSSGVPGGRGVKPVSLNGRSGTEIKAKGWKFVW